MPTSIPAWETPGLEAGPPAPCALASHVDPTSASDLTSLPSTLQTALAALSKSVALQQTSHSCKSCLSCCSLRLVFVRQREEEASWFLPRHRRQKDPQDCGCPRQKEGQCRGALLPGQEPPEGSPPLSWVRTGPRWESWGSGPVVRSWALG